MTCCVCMDQMSVLPERIISFAIDPCKKHIQISNVQKLLSVTCPGAGVPGRLGGYGIS